MIFLPTCLHSVHSVLQKYRTDKLTAPKTRIFKKMQYLGAVADLQWIFLLIWKYFVGNARWYIPWSTWIDRKKNWRNSKKPAHNHVRKFKVPSINFKASSYTNLIDWNTDIFNEPPLTINMSVHNLSKELKARNF
jgi:hypothetical protein